MSKRYKIHKAPPQTEKEKYIAHQKQRINQADNSYLKEARVLLLASLVAVLVPGLLTWFLGQLPQLAVMWWGSADALHILGGGSGLLIYLCSELVGLGLKILLAPITLLGFGGLCLKVWRGRKCQFKDVFAHCKGERRAAALGFSARFIPITALPGIAASLLSHVKALEATSLLLALSMAAQLALWGVSLWLLVRLLPAPLLHILAPQPPRDALGAAWALTAGQLGGMVRYGLRLLWRAGVGLVLFLFLMVVLAILPLPGSLLTLLATLAQYLIITLAAPLMWIGAIGYMDAWLPSDSQARKKGGQPDPKE